MATDLSLNAGLNLHLANSAALARQISKITSQAKLGISIKAAEYKKAQDLARGISNIGKEAKQTQDRLEEFGRGIGKYFVRFASFTLAASGVFKVLQGISKATEAALEFDNRMVRLRQITGSTRLGLKDLVDEVFRLSTSLGVSQASLTKAAETLAQAGYTATQTKQALEALAKADLAPTFKNMEETTDGLIATLNQFGKSTSESTKVLSQLNAVAAGFAVESSDLIKGIQRTGGVFAQSGASLEEFLALFTTVRQTTREAPETIAQGLKTIITRIQRVSTSDFLEKLGISGIRDETTKEFVGAYKAIEILSNGVKKFSKQSPELQAIIEELGGVRQIGKVLPLLNNFGIAQKALGVAQRGTNSLTKDSIVAQESLQRQLAKTQEEMTKLVVTFFEDKAVKAFISDTLELTTALIKLTQSLQPLLPLLAVMGGLRMLNSGVRVGRGVGQFLSNKIPGKASGGRVPGRGSKDDYPAMLMRGEYVISKKGVDAAGTSILDMINSGKVPHFASGGSDRKFKRNFKADVDAEYNRIRVEKLLRDQKIDEADIRKKAEQRVLKRRTQAELAEANRLNTLEQTGINNPLKVRGGVTSKYFKPVSLPVLGANQGPLNVGSITGPEFFTRQTSTVNRGGGRSLSLPNQMAPSFVGPHPQSQQSSLRSAQMMHSIHTGNSEFVSRVSSPASPVSPGLAGIIGSHQIATGTGEFVARPAKTKPFSRPVSSPVRQAGEFSVGAPTVGAHSLAPQGTRAEIFAKLRASDPNMSASEAFSRASRLSTQTGFQVRGGPVPTTRSIGEIKQGLGNRIDPIENLTLREKMHQLPLLKKQGALYAEMLKGLEQQKTIQQRITAQMPTLSGAFTKAKDAVLSGGVGKFGIPKMGNKFKRGAGIGALGLLMASQTDIGQDLLNGGGDRTRGGAGFSGAVQGGLTGLGAGAVTGNPVIMALAALTGATYGAVKAMKEFEKSAAERKLNATQTNFEKDPSLKNLKLLANDAMPLGMQTLESSELDTLAHPFRTMNMSTAGAINATNRFQTDFLASSGIGQNTLNLVRDQIKSEDIRSSADLSKMGSINIAGIDPETNQSTTQSLTILEILQKTLGESADGAKKYVDELIKQNKAQQNSLSSFSKLRIHLEDVNRRVLGFSDRITDFIKNLPDTNIRTIGDSSSLVERFSGLNKVGTAAFEDSVRKLPLSGADQVEGIKFNRLHTQLRNTLQSTSGDTEQNFVENFQKNLAKNLGPGFDSEIKAITSSLTSGGDEGVTEFKENLKTNFEGTFNDLLGRTSLGGVGEKLKELAGAVTTFRESILANTAKMFEGSSALMAGQIGLGATGLSNRRTINDLRGGGLTTAGLDDRNVRGGVAGAFGTADPESLFKFLTTIDKLAETDERYAEASKYVTSALTTLGDTSARTGDIMTRLNEVERSRAARISLRESFITGDPSSRRQLAFNLSTAKSFVESGGRPGAFGKLDIRLQKSIIEGLRGFGDALLGGKTGNKIADELLGTGLGETKERDKLISAFERVTIETERINATLLSRQAIINKDFISAYAKTGADFLSGFAGVLGRPVHRAAGGFVPGMGNSDSVPAMLTPGEFVMRKSAVSRIGANNLQRMNQLSFGGESTGDNIIDLVGGHRVKKASAGGLIKMAGGGLVGSHFDTGSLDRFNAIFSTNVSRFSEAAASIPHTIAMNVNHRLEVIMNGAQVFTELQPALRSLAGSMVTAEINRLIKEKFPDVGRLLS